MKSKKLAIITLFLGVLFVFSGCNSLNGGDSNNNNIESEQNNIEANMVYDLFGTGFVENKSVYNNDKEDSDVV